MVKSKESLRVICEKIKEGADKILEGDKKGSLDVALFGTSLVYGFNNPNGLLFGAILGTHRNFLNRIIDAEEEEDLKEIAELIKEIADSIIEEDETTINHDIREFLRILKKYRA